MYLQSHVCFFFGTASKQEAAVLKAVEEVHRTVEDAPFIV